MEKGRVWSWLRRRWRGGARGGGGEVRVEAEKVAAVKAAVWVACRPSTRESRSHLDSRRAARNPSLARWARSSEPAAPPAYLGIAQYTAP